LFFSFSIFILNKRHFWCHNNKKDENEVELGESRDWTSHFERVLQKTKGLTKTLEGRFEKEKVIVYVMGERKES
jgi:hypothetical protein